ncbi:MAG: glycosyltransferase [Desulfobacteraceae bacterium]|nr:MAG: glycosyltransferase [Desulfobacteraceae bacterium]
MGQTMKISILTSGTRGDVQPYIALGKALQEREHDVLIACPENFCSWVEEHGLKSCSIGIDMQAFLQTPEGKKLLSGNVLTLIKIWKQIVVPSIQKTLDISWEYGKDADLLIYHPKATAAIDVAEATGAGLICTALFPLFQTPAFPFFIFRGNFGPFLNTLSYKLTSLSRIFFIKMVNKWRTKTLGLGKSQILMPFDGHGANPVLRLCAVSPSVMKYPETGNAMVHTTGYWFLEEKENWQPDPGFLEFINSGEKPVYIGFGSMTTKDPERLTKEIIQGVQDAGLRAILSTGWGGLKRISLPEGIFLIENAPHDGLFNYVSAVVHHGGAGTTAAGLRAGLPTFICPAAFDQPYWGRLIHALGIGPKPLSIKKLNAKAFSKGLADLTRNESYRSAAKKIGKRIADENGASRAVDLIESFHQGGKAK